MRSTPGTNDNFTSLLSGIVSLCRVDPVNTSVDFTSVHWQWNVTKPSWRGLYIRLVHWGAQSCTKMTPLFKNMLDAVDSLLTE